VFHSGVFYYGVRREVYRSPVHLPIDAFIETCVQSMLASLPLVMGKTIRKA